MGSLLSKSTLKMSRWTNFDHPNHPKKIFEFFSFYKLEKRENFCQDQCSFVSQVARRAGEEKQKLFWSGLLPYKIFVVIVIVVVEKAILQTDMSK